MDYLCVIVNQHCNSTVREYEITANNESFARWKSKQLYKNDPKYDNTIDWTVDCVQMS